MLGAIRNAAQGVIGKAIMTVVMGLIIVSFVIWGVGDMPRGITTSPSPPSGERKSRPRTTAWSTSERCSNISASSGGP